MYAQPYEPAAPRALAALRRLARPLARSVARRSRSVHNLLRGPRTGALATVVYSDRYFRYGLRLRARHAPARRFVADELGPRPPAERRLPSPLCWRSARIAHLMPLHAPGARLAPRAGVLQEVGSPPAMPRSIGSIRVERSTAHILVVTADVRFEEPPARARPGPRRLLSYRQPAGGCAPRPPPPLQPRRRARHASPGIRSVGDGGGARSEAPRPQFALADEAYAKDAMETAEDGEPGDASGSEADTVELAYEALAKDSPRMSLANLARAPECKAPGRKVLNTERYNNGARALLVRGLCEGERGAGEWGTEGESEAEGVRGTVRAMLACSGLLYAVGFLTFYFLSLP